MTKTITRTQARGVECPACAARVGERCVGVRGRPREANHAERVQAAEATMSTTRQARNAERRRRIMAYSMTDVTSPDSMLDLKKSHAG